MYAKNMPNSLKSLLYSNISCLFELKQDSQKSKLYHTHSNLISEVKDTLLKTINFNNNTVCELNAKNYVQALESARSALILIEPLNLDELKMGPVENI
jgi:hypothetical protein